MGRAPEPLTDREQAFLRAFARALMTVPRELDADLMRGEGMSATEYFTLMHMSEVPGRSLRMSDLATAAGLSVSGMTRIVQRLEAQGFARRGKSTCDGRSRNAVLTDAGFQRLTEAWPTHLASVRRHVIDHLGDVDLEAFTAALLQFASDGCASGERADSAGAG